MSSSTTGTRISETLRLNLSEPELLRELYLATEIFREDVREGVAQYSRGEFASEEASRVIEERLQSATTLPSAEHRFYRDAIYLAWQHASGESVDHSDGTLQDLVSSMSNSQLKGFLLLCEDFDLLEFNRERFDEVSTLLESLILQGECGKALKVVRSNAAYLGCRLASRFRARAWSRLSRIDRRFDAISDRYRQAAGIGGNVLFKADRPAHLSASTSKQSVEQADLAFCAAVASDISAYDANPNPASEDAVQQLEAKLRSVYGMKHFDDEIFRSYLLEGWLQLTGAGAGQDAIGEVEAWEGLSDSQQKIADELLADFADLLDEHYEGDSLSKRVEGLVKKGRLSEALRLMRQASRSSSVALRASLYAEVWDGLTNLLSEPRFLKIALSFRRWSELCDWDTGGLDA